jgi:prophage regulatory protein
MNLMMIQQADVERQLLSIKEVAEMVGCSPATIYRRLSEGEFPRPVKVGNKTLWKRQSILDWVDELPEQ